MMLATRTFDPLSIFCPTTTRRYPHHFYLHEHNVDDDGINETEARYRYNRDEKEGRLQVELPGVAKKDTTIEVEGHTLTIIGKRFEARMEGSSEQEEGEKGMDKSNDKEEAHDTEEVKPTMVYKLTMKIGSSIDKEAIQADQRDGVLNVLFPVLAKQAPKKVHIQIAGL